VEDSITKDTIRLRGASSTVQYRGIPGLLLTSITGYRVNYSHFFEGEDDSAANLIEINWADSQKQFTQEFRGAGTAGSSTTLPVCITFNSALSSRTKEFSARTSRFHPWESLAESIRSSTPLEQSRPKAMRRIST